MPLARHAVVGSQGLALPSRTTASPDILAVETAFKDWEGMQNIGR